MESDFASVEEYIARYPSEIRVILNNIRDLILNSNSKIIETISYKMPAYKLNGKPLIYFAGYKNHIGLYATPSGHSAFEKELKKYKQGKGSVQFPLEQPIPYDLIKRIVEYRINENDLKGNKK